MSCKVSDTARAQLGVYLAHVARIDLPERDRHIVNELAVARLARAQIEVGSIVVGCAVDGNEQPVRSIVARAPYGNEGIAQDAIGGEAALDAAAFAVRSEEHTYDLQSLMRISSAVLGV